MDINSIINRLSSELNRLNELKKEAIKVDSFFTNDEHFNDELPSIDNIDESTEDVANSTENKLEKVIDENVENIITTNISEYKEIEPNDEITALVTAKERRLLAAQTMFKKSIKISLKSFLISISLSFLNLFI